MTYLDFNASAPMSDAVLQAAAEAARLCGNPSSVHAYGRASRAAVEAARRDVAAAIGAAADQLIFTSGATEANAIALHRCGRRRVIVSAVEHVSVLEAVPGAVVAPVDTHGVVDLDRLRALIVAGDGADTVVSVLLANNETGVLQPVDAVVALATEAGALVHCDAVQAPGRIPVDFAALGVDLMTLSAHKMGGPKGSGVLIQRQAGLIHADVGGGQERGLRSGTENVIGIAGFGAAAREAATSHARMAAVERLRDDMEARVRALADDAVIFGAGAARLPNTSSIGLPGVASETQVMTLDLAGVAVSAGAACSSGKIAASHVLLAMAVPEAMAHSAIRVSLGPTTTVADIDAFIEAWEKMARRKNRSAA